MTTITLTLDTARAVDRAVLRALLEAEEALRYAPRSPASEVRAEVLPVPPAPLPDAHPPSSGASEDLAGGLELPALSSPSTDASGARAQQPVGFTSIAPRVGSGAPIDDDDVGLVVALPPQVMATVEADPPSVAAGESPAPIPSERDAMMPDARTGGDGGASLLGVAPGADAGEPGDNHGCAPAEATERDAAAAGGSPAANKPTRPSKAKATDEWTPLVDRVLAGESCRRVATSAGVNFHRLAAYVGGAKARTKREAAAKPAEDPEPAPDVNARAKAQLEADRWNPERDLAMAETILDGLPGCLDRAAEKLRLRRDIVLARWNELLPIKGLREQSELLLRLRERVEQCVAAVE